MKVCSAEILYGAGVMIEWFAESMGGYRGVV